MWKIFVCDKYKYIYANFAKEYSHSSTLNINLNVFDWNALVLFLSHLVYLEQMAMKYSFYGILLKKLKAFF